MPGCVGGLQAPEMVRIPLEELVLQIHSLRLGPAAQFFARVLEPPPAKSTAGALAQLVAVGALTEDEQLTPLGTYLPLPPAPTPPRAPPSMLQSLDNRLWSPLKRLLTGQGLGGKGRERSI